MTFKPNAGSNGWGGGIGISNSSNFGAAGILFVVIVGDLGSGSLLFNCSDNGFVCTAHTLTGAVWLLDGILIGGTSISSSGSFLVTEFLLTGWIGVISSSSKSEPSFCLIEELVTLLSFVEGANHNNITLNTLIFYFFSNWLSCWCRHTIYFTRLQG